MAKKQKKDSNKGRALSSKSSQKAKSSKSGGTSLVALAALGLAGIVIGIAFVYLRSLRVNQRLQLPSVIQGNLGGSADRLWGTYRFTLHTKYMVYIGIYVYTYI